MANPLNKIDQEKLIITYKLLHDILFVSVVFFFLALLAEGVLPGIVTSHVGFSKIIFLIFLSTFLIYFLGDYLKIKLASAKINKKTAIGLVVVFSLLVINSLFKINFFLIFIITLALIFSGYYLYYSLVEETK